MMLDPDDGVEAYDESQPEEIRYWTTWRIVWLILALLIIIAMLTYLLAPFLYQLANPPPPPPTPPFGRI